MVPLQREQLLEHHAFAIVTIAKPAVGEQSFVALERVGQADDAGTRARKIQRARRDAQVARGKCRALELANKPEDVVSAAAAHRAVSAAHRFGGG